MVVTWFKHIFIQKKMIGRGIQHDSALSRWLLVVIIIIISFFIHNLV